MFLYARPLPQGRYVKLFQGCPLQAPQGFLRQQWDRDTGPAAVCGLDTVPVHSSRTLQ